MRYLRHWVGHIAQMRQLFQQQRHATTTVRIVPQIPSGFGQNRGILFFADDSIAFDCL